MRNHLAAAHRPPAERVERTTLRGADQYVLACNARRDADDVTFANIERIERENHQLRAEVEWRLAHASTRTGRWVRSRVIVIAWTLAFLAGVGGWMLSPNGREFRSGVAEGFQRSGARSP